MNRPAPAQPPSRISLLALSVAACCAGGTLAVLPAQAADEVNHERLLNADKEAGNWLLHHKNFAGHRFSPLKEINRDTVTNLTVAWTIGPKERHLDARGLEGKCT